MLDIYSTAAPSTHNISKDVLTSKLKAIRSKYREAVDDGRRSDQVIGDAQISVFVRLHDESARVKICVFKKFHFGYRFYFLLDSLSVFGLVMRSRVNARPIHKNILPYSPLALSCKRGLKMPPRTHIPKWAL